MKGVSIPVLVLGTIAVLVLTACGSSNATRSQFLHKGNAICRDAKADIRRAIRKGPRVGRLPARAFLNRVARKTLIPRLEHQVAALRRLPAPPEDAGTLRDLLDSLQSALEHSKRRPFTFGLAKDSPYATPDRLARDYGLTDCVSG